MKRCLLLACLLLAPKLFADSEEGCSIATLLATPQNSILESQEELDCTKEDIVKMSITEQLISVKVRHENQEVLIERESLSNKETCPPFCIEPMNIENIVTVAELEVLSFIDKLKEKKARLLIDVRESNMYAKGTIPGAINLPFSMLEGRSKYQEDVLKLLGAIPIEKDFILKWSFKNAQSLLIFGNSATSTEASNSIKELLKLGYPNSKLLYYRSGIVSWKAFGLTVR